MANGYTIFTTYLLKPKLASGYTPAIHCNYIAATVLNTTTPDVEEVRIIFPEVNDFKFLSNNISNGTGYTANYLYAIVQLVSGTTNVQPDPTKWKYIDITSQISGHTAGAPITPTEMVQQVFKVALLNYDGFSGYSINTNINGINYPSNLPIADSELCFGDETFFLGNVTAEIHADVYTTDLSVILPLGQYNSTNNTTWDGLSVFISEMGVYDGNNNLVAIGKFNDPVEKNANISRTILFAIDF